jgi:polysaccharide biosynthesis protein PslH
MIQHLSKSHEVTVASLAHDQGELRAAAPLAQHCKQVIAEVVPNRERWTNAVLALPTGFSSSAAYFRSRRLAERIREAWRAINYDGVIVHCAFAAQYALPLQRGFRIMDYGDLDSAKWSDYASHRHFPLSTGYALETAKLRKFEKQVAESSTHCTFTTQGELEAFQSYELSNPVTVIPNGVDTSYFHRDTRPPENSAVLAFLGRMDYFPNIDGICWFAREMFSSIRSLVPNARLRIIGSNPTRAVQELAAIPGVEVTGYVPDVRPYLADAAIAIAPLRLARGTQNKILECMGMGLPVVTTPQAARGIQATPGEHLLVADSPEQQIQSIVQLLQDPARRSQLGEAGRLQATSAHQWVASMRILDEVLRSASGV